MKRRIFSILFALVLVLSFSLITAVPSLAVGSSVPPAATGPQTLTGFGGGAGAHEFFLQPGSSWKGDLAGIGAGITWSLGIIGIDATGVIGPLDRYIYFNLQDADSGSHFKHVGINFYLESTGTGGGTLFQCYQQWTGEGMSSHGLNPGELTTSDFDLRFDFTKATYEDGWTCTPYFRLSGGVWTPFWDGSFTATVGSVDFDAGKLIVGFDGGADGTLTFDNYYIAGPVSEVFVDDDWAGLSDGTAVQFPGDTIYRTIGIDAFDNIQDGIDSVVASTVNVAAGIYTETLVIDKQLTLQGAGSASTIIDATGGAPGILLTAGGVSASQRLTIKGLTVKNSTLDGIRAYKAGGLNLDHVTLEDIVLTLNSGKGMEIHNDVTVSDMEINGCEFVSNVAEGLRTASNVVVDGMTITDSKFNGNSYGIYLQGTINGVTILRSEFNNSNGGYGGYMTETGPLTNLVIEDSEFNNNVVGLMVWNEQDNAGITIRRTSFQNNEKWGVLIWGAALTNVLIEGSTVLNNDGLAMGYYGIDFNAYGEVMTNVAVHFTSITGHTVGGGVKNRNTAATAIVDATNNWWGDEDGPQADPGQIPDGENVSTGDKVSDYVHYKPWLGVPIETYFLLEDLGDEIEALPDEAFLKDPDDRRDSLIEKVEAVVGDMVAKGHYKPAINKLERDIKDKIEKWIIEDEQRELIEKVDAVVAILEDLL